MSLWTQLAQRHCQPELMDDPNLPEDEHHRALRGLARLNRLTAAWRPFWPPLRRLAQDRWPEPVRVLDVASGSGDSVLRLWHQAQRSGLTNLEFTGSDISPKARAMAQRHSEAAGAEIDWLPLDVVRQPLPEGFDVLTCSLFLHHLSEADAQNLLAEMGRVAGHLVVVSDLERSDWNWWLVHAGFWVTLAPRIVRIDGDRSIRAAFSLPELRRLAEAAGLDDATIRRVRPARQCLVWNRS